MTKFGLGDSVLSAFQVAAGVSSDKLSLLIRTLLLVITFVWAGWCIYGEIHLFRHHDMEIYDLFRKCLRILFILVLMMSLVFIA